MSSVREEIIKRLERELAPTRLEVVDDSARHAGHREAGEAVESHFNVVIASESFRGVPLVRQHKMVYEALDGIVGDTIHALGLTTSAE